MPEKCFQFRNKDVKGQYVDAITLNLLVFREMIYNIKHRNIGFSEDIYEEIKKKNPILVCYFNISETILLLLACIYGGLKYSRHYAKHTFYQVLSSS